MLMHALSIQLQLARKGGGPPILRVLWCLSYWVGLFQGRLRPTVA